MQSSDPNPPGPQPDDGFHQNPHDSLFRSTFSQPEHAAGLLRSLLPKDALAHFNFNTFVLQSASFVDQHLKNLYSDLLFAVQLQDGCPALIYLLFEHQSSADPWMPLRMLAYLVRIWENFIESNPNSKKLPLILPLLIHHHPEQMPASPDFEALYDISPEAFAPLRNIALKMHVLIDNLNACSSEDIQRRETLDAVSKLVLIALRNSRSVHELIATLHLWAPLIAEILNAPNGRMALRRILRYMSVTQKAEFKDIWNRNLFQQLAGLKDAQEIAMNIAEAYVQEGRSKGRIEGKIEGRIEGLQSLLHKLLTQRFGLLPDTALARIHSAEAEELELWGERILLASSLEDVFH